MMKKYLPLFFLLFLFACGQDLCKDVTCQNGGSCNKNGFCECPIGYEGLQCEIAAAKKFIGNYKATYNCVSAENTVAIETKPGNEPLTVTIRNLGDYLCPEGDYLLNATIQNDSLILNNQQVCAGAAIPSGYTFNGFAKLKGDTLRMTFTVFYSNSQTDNCQAVLIKE